MTLELLPMFVYGTLQRGEQRGSSWPRQPQSIQWATIQGQLCDLGEYPALVDGTYRVLGELWSVAEEDLPITLRTLDAIEGFAHREDDLFIRRIVRCVTWAGKACRAYTYFYANPAEIARAPAVAADPHGLVHWRRRNPQPPELP